MTTKSPSNTRKMQLLDGSWFSRAAMQDAVDILDAAPGYMVRQPLAKAGSPLAASGYLSIAALHDPEHTLAAPMDSSTSGRMMNTKPAFLDYLRQLLAESA